MILEQDQFSFPQISNVKDPRVEKLRKVFRYLRERFPSIKYSIDDDTVKIMIKSKRIVIEPHNEVRIKLDEKDELWVHWFEKDDKYFIDITVVLVDEDLFGENEEFIEISFEGYFEIRTKKGVVILRLTPESLVSVVSLR